MCTMNFNLYFLQLPSGQSNQLVKARQARSVPDPEDTSNEDGEITMIRPPKTNHRVFFCYFWLAESTDHATNDRSQRSRDMISCVSHPSNNVREPW